MHILLFNWKYQKLYAKHCRVLPAIPYFFPSSPSTRQKKRTTYRKSNTLLHIFMDCVFFKFYEILLFCQEVENHSKIFALILIL